MKKLLLILLVVVSSCASSTVHNLYKLTEYKNESTHFDIYHAKGYFYKGVGFVMVKHIDNSIIIFKCNIDTVYVKQKKNPNSSRAIFK